MTMTETRVGPPQAFKVEREVRDWTDETRGRPIDFRNIVKFMGVTTVAVTALLTACTLLTPNVDRDTSGTVWTLIVGGVLSAACLAFTIYVLRTTRGPVIAAKTERKKRAQAFRRSRKTAKALGGSVVPVLTKEHVEAMAKLGLAVAGNGALWSRSDTERVRALLLEDLDRADSLVNLIEAHEAISLDRLLTELADLEAKPKPLQGGWL